MILYNPIILYVRRRRQCVETVSTLFKKTPVIPQKIISFYPILNTRKSYSLIIGN